MPIRLQILQSIMATYLHDNADEIVVHNLGGITSQYMIGFKAHTMSWNPHPMLLGWPAA